MQQDYYSSLFKVITASARDNPQLRKRIYGLARTKLRQQLNREVYRVAQADKARHMLALETAIEQIESDLAANAQHQHAMEGDVLSPIKHTTINLFPPPSRPLLGSEVRYETIPTTSGQLRMVRWLALPIAAVVAVSAAIYAVYDHVALDRANGDTHSGFEISDDRSSPRSILPTAYGIYALVDGRLIELEPLAVRVPDRGSIPILTATGRTKLVQGRIQFLAYRPDLANSAPEKVMVRGVAVAAEIQGAAPKQDGTADSASEQWNIRRISYDMKVAPVEGNAAMITIRAADANFSFPAGNYALVLKGTGYEFSVVEAARPSMPCVERDDRPNRATNKLCGAHR
jgi:hypothetical protein